MRFEEIALSDIYELAKIYVETFTAPPWKDEWTIDTASRDDGTEGFIGREG